MEILHYKDIKHLNTKSRPWKAHVCIEILSCCVVTVIYYYGLTQTQSS